MDKTLADYITRTMARLEAENQQKVQKDLEPQNQDVYNVYPEPQNRESDEKINPYGQH